MAIKIIKEDLFYREINICGVISGSFFESENDLYIKLDNYCMAYSISEHKLAAFHTEAMVYEVKDCEIKYSKIRSSS